MDSQEFDFKTGTHYLQRFKATETSYEEYSEPIYFFRLTVTRILVHHFAFWGVRDKEFKNPHLKKFG